MMYGKSMASHWGMGETHLGNDLVHLDLLCGVDATLLRKLGWRWADFQQQKLRFDMF